jgi:hypothetical protein
MPYVQPPPPAVTGDGPDVSSSFDDTAIIDYHPVDDAGPITGSVFDDLDKVNYHPVP